VKAEAKLAVAADGGGGVSTGAEDAEVSHERQIPQGGFKAAST
jgi:hypothetical protein